jgi:hypothetical protein
MATPPTSRPTDPSPTPQNESWNIVFALVDLRAPPGEPDTSVVLLLQLIPFRHNHLQRPAPMMKPDDVGHLVICMRLAAFLLMAMPGGLAIRSADMLGPLPTHSRDSRAEPGAKLQ